MQFVTEIIARTPLWVWALFAFLLFIGVRALRPSTASFARLAILPLVFLVWGLSGFVTTYGFRPLGIAVWLAAGVIGFALGRVAVRAIAIQADKERGLIRLPGSAAPLVLILTIFATKYVLGVLSGIQPGISADPLYMAADVGVSGLLTGMFAGRIYGLRRKYQATPHEEIVG